MPVIAFQAVEALLSCFELFKGLPSNEQQAKTRFSLQLLRHWRLWSETPKTRAKLQVAFRLLNNPQWPTQIGELRHHAVMLAVELQRPPSKKELKEKFDSTLPEQYPVLPSEFSRLLKAAGLSWLKRGQRV